MPFEKYLEVLDPPMINIGIRFFQAPKFGIQLKMRHHIFMYFFLQVYAELPIGADHDIGTYAFIRGHVAIGIGDRDIGGIVFYFLIGQADRCI